MRNAPDAPAASVPQFHPAASTVRVNVYWFSSLILSLSAALITILAKQWVNYLLAGLSSVPAVHARHRQYRMDGMQRWKLPGVLSFLPILLHISLLLFFVGLVDFVWDINRTVATISAILVCITALVYFGTNLLAYVFSECPFKTSFTDFVALVVDTIFLGFTELRQTLSDAYHLAPLIYAIGILRLRRHIPIVPSSLIPSNIELTDFPRTGTMTRPTPRRRAHSSALRISSLRADDDRFVTENASLMDARVILWLMHNAYRIRAAEMVGTAITQFPHLILHRRLFIAQGVCVFLEGLLQTWHTQPSFHGLGKLRKVSVSETVRTLAILESEAEPTGPELSPRTLPSHSILADPGPPLATVARVEGLSMSHLTPPSCKIIMSLLNEAHSLPLPLAAFALRLSVRIPETAEYAPLQPLSIVLKDYILRIMSFESIQGQNDDALQALDTLVYLALHDVSYPERRGFAISYTGDARHWLKTLTGIMVQARLSSAALYHLSWAICTLAWTLQHPSDIVKPRIPRITVQDVRQVHDTLLSYLTYDADPDALCAALAALECLLWRAVPGGSAEVRSICQASYPVFSTLIVQLRASVRHQQIPDSLVASLAISITRIAVYLALYDPVTAIEPRIHLLTCCLDILRHLLDVSMVDDTVLLDVARPTLLCKDTDETTSTSPDVEGTVRGWMFRAASRILTIYLDRASLRAGPGPDTNELAFVDTTAACTGTVFVQALEMVRRRDLDKLTQSEPLIFDASIAIMRHAFFPRRQIGHSDVEVAESDAQVVTEFIKLGGLLSILALSTGSVVVTTELLRPAIHFLRMLLPVEGTAVEPVQAYHTGKAGDGPAVPLLRSDVLSPYLAFATEVASALWSGTLRQPEMEHIILAILHILLHLAFWRRNCRLSNAPDSMILKKMITVIYAILVGRGAEEVSTDFRRHAWRIIGDLVPNICYSEHIFRGSKPDPRFYQNSPKPFSTLPSEGLAVGLLRTLSITYVVRGSMSSLMADGHCARCDLKQIDAVRILDLMENYPDAEETLQACAWVTLRVISALWEHDDLRSEEMRDYLVQHGLVSRLRIFMRGTGRSGEEARNLHRKIVNIREVLPPTIPGGEPEGAQSDAERSADPDGASISSGEVLEEAQESGEPEGGQARGSGVPEGAQANGEHEHIIQ